MVKSLISIAVAVLLLAGAAVYEWVFVDDTFRDFKEEVQTLYTKLDNETANADDARIVQESWERRKENLCVWIPHNDISRIDDYISEMVGFVEEKDYPLAIAKLEIILHLTGCVPDTYRPNIENIF